MLITHDTFSFQGIMFALHDAFVSIYEQNGLQYF
jgi:hypothetical protein